MSKQPSFIDLHVGQLQNLNVPKELWNQIQLQIENEEERLKAIGELFCKRDPSKSAPTKWSLYSKEEQKANSKVYVLEHVCTCDANIQTRMELKKNPALLQMLWELFDIECNIPEKIKSKYIKSQQIAVVLQMTDASYVMAVRALEHRNWELLEAINLIEENAAELAMKTGTEESYSQLHATQTYFWKEDKETDNIIVTIETNGVDKNDVRCRLSITHCEFFIKDELVMKGDFSHPIDVNGSTWFIRDNKVIEMHLTKRVVENKWGELLKGEQAGIIYEEFLPLTTEEQIDLVMITMQTYFAQSYVVANQNSEGKYVQQLVWYMLDRLGSSLNFVSDPNDANCICKIFIHIPTGVSYSVLVPIKDISAGTPLSCVRTSKTRSGSSYIPNA